MLFVFNNIRYSLGLGQARQVLTSGAVTDGEVLVVRGPSGAGKSTLFRVLARLQPCLSGEVFLKGENWLKIQGTTWRVMVHYLAQKASLFDGTVADNLLKPFETRMIKDKKKFDLNLAKAVMDELLLTPDLWEQDARTLSGGEASRLAFVRALLIDPNVLLLDEPTAALDEKSRKAFYRVLSKWLIKPNRAALLISHNDDFKIMNRLSFLDIKAVQKGV